MPEPVSVLRDLIQLWLPTVIASGAVAGILALANWLLISRARPTNRLPRQLAMLALTGAGAVLVVLTLPVSELERGQLLGLLGLLVSATIALSSTTIIGNILAGLMLRVLRNFRAGDFVEVDGHFGRVSERGLFHVEIQTEDRDLTTLPNLWLATRPVKVVRASGTIVSANVSLGYDVAHGHAESLLRSAVENAGLQDPFVQILELGDHSVRYRAAGFLREVRHLLGVRSALRACMLDALHGAGVEALSPTFMNQRAVPGERRIIPAAAPTPSGEVPEQVIFDKAVAAQTREELASEDERLREQLDGLEHEIDAAEGARRQALERELGAVRSRHNQIADALARDDDPER